MDKRIAQQYPKESGRGHQNYKAPKGMLVVAFEDAKRLGCVQATDAMMFDELMKVAKFNPCNGCPEWDRHGPKCQCFQAHHTSFRDAKVVVAIEEARQRELHRRKTEQCSECGLRVRGPNHAEGQQHKRKVAAKSK